MALTDRQLVDTFKQSASTMSGPQITSFLIGNGFYRNVGQIVSQLQHAGVTKTAAQSAVQAKGPSALTRILQAGGDLLYVPGSVAAEVLGGGAAADSKAAAGVAGAGGAASSAASSGLNAAGKALAGATVLDFLTSGQNWIRLLEVIAGAILIVMGLRTLSGRDTTPVTVVSGGARAAAKAVRV